MSTSASLYNAVHNDDIDLLTPGSIVDYGFFALDKNDWHDLFGAYQSISRFNTEKYFVDTLHNAYINNNLNKKVGELTSKLPKEFQNHWNNFISKHNEIKLFYI
jgi:hypothetical protein